MNKILSFCFVILFSNTIFSQVEIFTEYSIEFLVKNILIGKNSNLTVNNIKYTGSPLSIAYFTNPNTELVMRQGIILSTGFAVDVVGPNNSSRTGETVNYFTDSQLAKIGNGKSGDVTILEFDFIPYTDSIIFNYIFASEEYPEYVNKGVNDVFAFFVNKKGTNKIKNIAIINNEYNEPVPVTINTINEINNSKYFIANNNNNSVLYRNFQFDGFTKLLTARINVIPFNEYHIKIAICDIGDRYFDSAVFLKKQSFKSKGNVIINTQQQLNKLVSSFFSNYNITEEQNSIKLNYNINFEFDSYKITDIKSFKFLDKIVSLLQKNKKIKLNIYGYTDNIGTKTYNKKLSENRSKTVYQYLISQNIESYRLSYFGKGADNLINTKSIKNSESKNRRVEFVFSL